MRTYKQVGFSSLIKEYSCYSFRRNCPSEPDVNWETLGPLRAARLKAWGNIEALVITYTIFGRGSLL